MASQPYCFIRGDAEHSKIRESGIFLQPASIKGSVVATGVGGSALILPILSVPSPEWQAEQASHVVSMIAIVALILSVAVETDVETNRCRAASRQPDVPLLET